MDMSIAKIHYGALKQTTLQILVDPRYYRLLRSALFSVTCGSGFTRSQLLFHGTSPKLDVRDLLAARSYGSGLLTCVVRLLSD